MKICLSTSLLLLLSLNLPFESSAQTSLRKTKDDKAHSSYNGVTGGALKVLLSRLKCDPTNPPFRLPTNPPLSLLTSIQPTATPSSVPTSKPTNSEAPTNFESPIKLLAPDGAIGDQFGWAVAASDEVIVVGCRFQCEAVYLYSRAGSFTQKLTAPFAAVGDSFGFSVSFSENIILIGAHGKDDNGIDSGCAYVFTSDGSFISKLIAPDGAAGDEFGYSVSISNNNIVIGARGNADNGIDSGSAYVFRSDGFFIIKLTPPDAASGDIFGNVVSISNDIIVIGAPNNDDNESGSGSAYVFTNDGTFIGRLTAPDAAAGDEFGESISISDNVIMIGAHGRNDDGIVNTGSVYIYTTDGIFAEKLTAPDAAALDNFGRVSVFNNVAVIGAWGDIDNGGAPGAAYIFSV